MLKGEHEDALEDNVEEWRGAADEIGEAIEDLKDVPIAPAWESPADWPRSLSAT